MRIVVTAGLTSLLVLLAGCETHRPYTYTTPTGQVISSGVPRNASDVALESNVRAELNRYGDLGSASQNVQVNAENGTVTLTGTVPNDRDRQMMDTLVRNTAGVVALNDQLQVAYPPTGAAGAPPQVYTGPAPAPVVTPPQAPAPANYPDYRVLASTPGDEPVAASIVDHLRREGVHPDWLQTANITVRDGNAYLEGTVPNLPDHQAVVSAVQRSGGVKAVYDQLQNRE